MRNKTLLETSRRQKAMRVFNDPKSSRIKEFVIMTPENPDAKELPPQENRELCNDFERRIKESKIQFYKVKGKFAGNTEHSYILFNVDVKTGIYFSKEYEQQSFIYVTNNGDKLSFTYYAKSNKTYKEIETKDVYTDEANAEDNFTQVCRQFKFNIPFDIFNESLDECLDYYDYVEGVIRKDGRFEFDTLIENLHNHRPGHNGYFDRAHLHSNKNANLSERRNMRLESMKNKKYIKEDTTSKGFDPYEPTSEKISKNLRGLSLKLGQIFDSVKEGDTLTAMTEMTNFKSMTDSVLKQMASFYDDSPAEDMGTMQDNASPEGAIPIGEGVEKKKKRQPELPNKGLNPVMPEYSESEKFFNHQSQGNGQTQNITNTADAIGESFRTVDEQLWDDTVMLKNELTGKMEECKVFNSLDKFNEWVK